MPQQFEAEQLRAYLGRVFEAWGVDPAYAPGVADAYVTADLFGLASHGVMRIPRIADGIEAGTHHPASRPTIVRERQSTALVDGASGLGVAVALFAMETAITKARESGVACVGVYNSNHFGTAGYYVRRMAAEGMVGLCFCNSSPGIASPGGTRAILGTNPVAIGAPRTDGVLALDMSVAAIVRGKVLELQRTGRPLPDGVAVAPDGSPTTDPTQALAGSFLPYGGPQAYKTFGLALMIDVLCGPLMGAAFADGVQGSADTTVDCTKGDCFIAIDVSAFRESEDFLSDVDALAAAVKGSGEGVILPGEIEDGRLVAAGGIVTLDDDMAGQILALGDAHGVAPPD